MMWLLGTPHGFYLPLQLEVLLSLDPHQVLQVVQRLSQGRLATRHFLLKPLLPAELLLSIEVQHFLLGG